MKKLLLLVLSFAPLAPMVAWDNCAVCDDEAPDYLKEYRQGVPEYVPNYPQYEASWPNKDTDPLIESLKN